MRGRAAVALTAGLLAACGSQDLGRRYRAERAIVEADQQYQRLRAGPAQVSDDRWRMLAQQYELIADRCLPHGLTQGQTPSPRQLELAEIAARALFDAAQILGGVQDSVRVDQIFQHMATTFVGMPHVVGEVSLSRARIAEARGDLKLAVAYYRQVVDQFEPRPDELGVAGLVLPLPLRIGRLTAQMADAPADSFVFAWARQYYRRVVADRATARLSVEARGYLADIARDVDDWGEVTRLLQRQEAELHGMPAPPLDPSAVRLEAVMARAHVRAAVDSMRTDVEQLLRDYPKSAAAPRALLAYANELNARGRLEDALGVLSHLLREYDDDQACPEAMLAEGQLLDRLDRWKEAVVVYRSLKRGFPISFPALRSHLEIADHYLRTGNEYARMEALEQAQSAYREFLKRYPENPFTYRAWELLIRTLTLQQKHALAIDEMLALSQRVAGSSKESQLLIEAAHVAATQLGDTTRAVGILEQTAQHFPQTRVGAWSSREAQRLRRGSSP